MNPALAVTHAARTVVSLVRRASDRKQGSLAARGLVPLLHLTSAAARKLAMAPSPVTTRAQKLALHALGAQLRAAASSILPSEASSDPNTLEGALAQAVADTLRLLESALHEGPALHGSPEPPPSELPFTVSEGPGCSTADGTAERAPRLTPSE